MKTSETTTDLLTALCAARLDFPTITRNREGFSKRTGQKYGYADLNAIIDTTEPVLGQYGLLLVQSVEDGEWGMLRITSTLFHASSGQWLSSDVSVTKPDDMQNFGMTCTYLKRYAQQALLNISTEDDDDAASLNGSNKAEKPAAAAKLRASEPVSANGHTPPLGEPTDRPSEQHITALQTLALTECGEDRDVFEQRIRTIMGLKPAASVAPKLLTRTMDMSQYMQAFEYYTKLKAQLARKTTTPEVPHGTPSQDTPLCEPASTATGTATEEGHPADPSPGASLSAPDAGPDAAELDRIRLRAEVAKWDLRVPPEEVEHVIQHNPYSRARQLLWKCRRDTPAATQAEAAAD
jgi:hypothetical protein